MDKGTTIFALEMLLLYGGAFTLLWLDRRTLARAKEESARHQARERAAAARARPSPALVPTATDAAPRHASGQPPPQADASGA